MNLPFTAVNMPGILIIGEKLNSSNPTVKRLFAERNEARLLEIAQNQVECGSTYIDLNASMMMADEEESLSWGARAIMGKLDTRVCLDSPNTEMLLKLIPTFGARVILNSLTSDTEVLETALPVVAEARAEVIVMLKSEDGIPPSVEGRLKLADTVASIVSVSRISPRKVFLDPVFAPLATSPKGLKTALETTTALKRTHPDFQRVGGLSNVSYGLPLRKLLNRTFLSMAVSYGMTALICDPTDTKLREAFKASEALMGLDTGCREFLKFYRNEKKKKKHS